MFKSDQYQTAKVESMYHNIETLSTVISYLIKAVVLAAQFSGRARKRQLKRVAQMDIDEKDKEIFFLRDKVYQQAIQISILQKGLKKKDTNKRYTLDEKLFILNYVETFQIPRNKLSEYVGIAKSTYYRWMRNIETQVKHRTPANKTPAEIAALAWEIAKNNTNWGRMRIASQLALLKVFISASTVRNILNRPQPRKPKNPPSKQKIKEQVKVRSIPAWYPNHVWSIDNTSVFFDNSESELI